jgi:competence protein ComEA
MLQRLLAVIVVALIAGAPFAHGQQPPASEPSAAAAKATGGIVNLNTATAAQLEALPGIGAKMALRILDYRTKNGSFKKVEELMNVKGIGEKAFLKLKSQLTIGAAK